MPTALGVLLLLALAACGGERKPGEDMIAELTRLRDEMCACPDRACADDVDARRAELAASATRRYGELRTLPKEVVNRLVVIDQEMRACRDKLP